jgi:hypothetical protein
MKGTLVIFVKAPVAGRVKTRLARGVGPARASTLFRHMTRQTIAEASRGGWTTILAVDRPSAVRGFSNLWPDRLTRSPQARGDLGRRMKAAFEQAPRGPVVIIGADAPGVRTRLIRRAFAALQGSDAVFGPTEDGGYWLIGLAGRRKAPRIFHKVRWSTRHALEDTLSTLPASFRVAFIDRLRDIDDADDLKALGGRAFLRSLARI